MRVSGLGALGRPALVTRQGALDAVAAARPVPLGTGGYSEAWLQALIDRCPEILPLGQIEDVFDGARAICRELPTPRGYVDNLLMTPDGQPVLVETKLWRNPEARRQVVAQAVDYAAAVAAMGYEELDRAVQRARAARGQPEEPLHRLLGVPDGEAEQDFIDDVARRLRAGQIGILIVGDGIREEVETLVTAVQAHAGVRFSLGMVALSLFELPAEERLLLVPHTLMKTVMLERGVVRIEQGQVVVSAPPAAVAAHSASLSEDEFFEAMRQRDPRLPDALKQFLERLAKIGVYVDMKRSLNIKWDRPSDGRDINLGYIQKNGQIWTNATAWFMSKELAIDYWKDVAAAWSDGVLDRMGAWGEWYVAVNGRAPRIETLIDRLPAWAGAIERFIDRLSTEQQAVDPFDTGTKLSPSAPDAVQP